MGNFNPYLSGLVAGGLESLETRQPEVIYTLTAGLAKKNIENQQNQNYAKGKVMKIVKMTNGLDRQKAFHSKLCHKYHIGLA